MVKLWRIPLTMAPALSAARASCLDAAERRRAERFESIERRQRWRLAHVALREILGAELAVAPHEVQFDYEPSGRPRLANWTVPSFSLSHALDIALVAVSDAQAIGVDVEQERPVPGRADVLREVFTRREQQFMAALGDLDSAVAFLRGWTRKEAVVKALGRGIESMGRVEVSLDRAAPRLLSLDFEGEDAAGWSLIDPQLASPFVAAVAVRGPAANYELRDWTIS